MKHCIIDTRDSEITEKLNSLGYICHSVIPSNRVSEPICRHSDVLYLKTCDFTFTVSCCQKENIPLLNELGYKVNICENLSPGYKTESLLNFIINEDYIIRNPSTTISCCDINRQEIHVKQGYTRCSTICVNNRAYITDDEGIYKTLKSNGLDCLKIEKGEILLEGYNYGFIGGASVKLNDHEILFFGDIQNTADKISVTEFLNKYNMKPIFIENKKLTDIGSRIIL